MYSSVSSALGNLGQANYASSNTYLDSLAACTRQSARVARSVQWPMVTGAGMGQATHDALGAGRGADIGLGALDLDQYAAALHSVLGAQPTVGLLVAAIMSGSPFAEVDPQRAPPFLSELASSVSKPGRDGGRVALMCGGDARQQQW